MLFFLLINGKMPTIVGILTYMGRKISCSAELNMKTFFLTQGPGRISGALQAQWVKCWSADLMVPGLCPAGGRNLFYGKQGTIAHSLPLLPFHRPDLTKILLKRM